MKSLENHTDDELRQELETRMIRRQDIPPAIHPHESKVKEFFDYMVEWRDQVANDLGSKEDEHMVFERAVELIFGTRFWAWYNFIQKDQ